MCDARDLQVHTATRCGTPARELAAAAAQYSADMVVGASSQAWHQVIGSCLAGSPGTSGARYVVR